MIGQVIGNYRIVSELGRGGMGMVYRAEHVQLGRPAALKMLLPQMSADPSIVQRFFNEARAASGIDHPGIVEVYDFGTHTDGSAYIVMALLKGESLEARLKRGPMAPLEGATLIVQALSALAAAHQRGIVHRDLKPDNIFLTPNELIAGGTQVKLLDFGIAKLGDDKAAGVKTQTGMMIGTPAYMSPEQCMGLPDLDHRTDIYSVGCILFHILCGRPPFMSDHGTGMIIAAQMRDAPADPRSINPSIPGPLAAIVLRCLEKDPKARFQNANELKNALINAGAQGTVSRPAVVAAGGAMAPDSYAATMAGPASIGIEPTAYPSAQAMTTASGSAAEVVGAATAARPKRGKGALIAVGAVLLALGGVGIGVALNSSSDDQKQVVATSESAPAPATPPAAPPAAPTPTPTPVAPAPAESAAPATESGGLDPSLQGEGRKPRPDDPPRHGGAPPHPDHIPRACPEGMKRHADSAGNCCWEGQAWSTAKTKCVGKPTCPPGMKVKAETCIAVPVSATGVLAFKLDAKRYAPGAPITIAFPGAMSSKPNSRAWVTVVEQTLPPSRYGTWEYVADGAKIAKLVAPSKPGEYEVRLHTNYPTQSTNVVHSVALTVGEPAALPAATKLKFSTKKQAAPGEEVTLVFAQAMIALPNEKFWVTVTKPDEGDSAYHHYDYVPANAKTMSFKVPDEPGDYEIRLHANYPTKATNLVHRVKIHVGD